MEKCKFCGAQMEEEVTLCPECGKDNKETEEITPVEELAEEAAAAVEMEEMPAEAPEAEDAEEEQSAGKATPKKIAVSVIAIVLLLAMIAGMLMIGMKPAAQQPADTTTTEEPFQGTIPADGNPEDVTCKGSYSVSDAEAAAGAATVVATMGDQTLTNAQLQVYYWNYVKSYLNSENGYMALMSGQLDFSHPLDMQVCAVDPTMTWQQFFLAGALDNWKFMQALAIEAKASGFTISEADKQALESTPESLESTAVQMGYASAQDLLVAEFGAGITMDDYMHFEELYYNSIPYYNAESAKLTVTDEEAEAFFAEHEEEYAQLGLLRTDVLVDVRHILIMPEGATNATIRSETFPEEAWAASEKRAQEIVQEYLDGDQTEARFSELANTYTQDANDSNMDGQPDGGLYTGVTKQTSFVPEFLAWCMDANRQVGDVEIVRTQFGFHIMYFSKTEALWPQYARQDAMVGKSNDLIAGVVERNPDTVDYSAITLAALVMG